MSVLDHHDMHVEHADQNRCVLMFAMTWVGFFALIGLVTYLASLF